MNDKITPSHAANFFLDEARDEDVPLTLMKLMKLVYIGYGWVQATLDESLFEEPIEAWKQGPVIPSLYHEFKWFEDQPITTQSMQLEDSKSTKFLGVAYPTISASEEDILYVLKYVWDVYGSFTASSLRDLTIEDDTPWYKAQEEGYNYEPISTKDIREHFDEKIHECNNIPYTPQNA